jgi:hypothetical protein
VVGERVAEQVSAEPAMRDPAMIISSFSRISCVSIYVKLQIVLCCRNAKSRIGMRLLRVGRKIVPPHHFT